MFVSFGISQGLEVNIKEVMLNSTEHELSDL